MCLVLDQVNKTQGMPTFHSIYITFCYETKRIYTSREQRGEVSLMLLIWEYQRLDITFKSMGVIQKLSAGNTESVCPVQDLDRGL